MPVQWRQKAVATWIELFHMLWPKRVVSYLDLDGSQQCAGWMLQLPCFALVNNDQHMQFVLQRVIEEAVIPPMANRDHALAYQGDEVAKKILGLFPKPKYDDVSDDDSSGVEDIEEGNEVGQ